MSNSRPNPYVDPRSFQAGEPFWWTMSLTSCLPFALTKRFRSKWLTWQGWTVTLNSY